MIHFVNGNLSRICPHGRGERQVELVSSDHASDRGNDLALERVSEVEMTKQMIDEKLTDDGVAARLHQWMLDQRNQFRREEQLDFPAAKLRQRLGTNRCMRIPVTEAAAINA